MVANIIVLLIGLIHSTAVGASDFLTFESRRNLQLGAAVAGNGAVVVHLPHQV